MNKLLSRVILAAALPAISLHASAQTGNVGIGTATPNTKLQVVDATAPIIKVGTAGGVDGGIQLGNANHGLLRNLTTSTGGAGNDMALYTTQANLFLVANPSATGNASLPLGQFTLNTSGNVGIGTTTPGSKLQVVGSFAPNYTTVTTTTYTVGANDYYVVYNGTANGTMTLPAGTVAMKGRNYFIKNTTQFSLTVNPAGTETIDGNSSIAIGPGEVAQIVMQGTTGNGNATSEVASFGTGTTVGGNTPARPWTTTGNAGTSATTNFIGTTDAVDFVTRTNGTEKMRVTSAGNVGIGINAPSTALQVVSATPVIAVGTSGNVGGRLQLGNANHGLQRDLTGSTGGNGNDMALFTTQANLYLVANPSATGNTSLPLGQFTLNTSGNVGIGTTTPNAPLQFANSAANRKIVLWEDANNDHQFYGLGLNSSTLRYQVGATTEDHVWYAGTSTTTSRELARIKGDGNMQLGVYNNNGTANRIIDIQGNSGDYAGMRMGQFSNAYGSAIIHDDRGTTGNEIGLHFKVSYAGADVITTASRMYISTAGNVGIGTTVPTAPLHIVTTSAPVILERYNSAAGNYSAIIMRKSANNTVGTNTALASGDGIGRIAFSAANGTGFNSNAEILCQATGAQTTTGAGADIVFNTTPSGSLTIAERMRISDAGNIGIGTQTPSVKLDVASSTNGVTIHMLGAYNGVSQGLRLENSNGNGQVNITPGYDFSGSLAANTPVVTFDIVGTGYFEFGDHLIPVTDNSFTLGSSSRRWSTVYAAAGTINTSDARMKKNVRNLGLGLDAVMKLRPVVFDWKDNTGKDKIGFIAQELRQVVPNVVVGDESKETLGVYYSDMIPVLTKAIQEQQATIEKQQAEITTLKAQAAEVAEMKTAMAEMRAELSKVVLKKVAGKNVARK